MSLKSFHIALQGVGFRLNPIALAVQGLLDELEEDAPKTYYGSGKQYRDDSDLRRRVLEKYEAIERARREDKTRDLKNKQVDPLAKLVAEDKRQRIIAQARAKNIAKAKATAEAEAATKAAIERAQRPKIEMPFAAAAQAAAKAASDQHAEDDQIMALMAMMLLEE